MRRLIEKLVKGASARCSGMRHHGEQPPKGIYSIRTYDNEWYEIVSPGGVVVERFHDEEATLDDLCFWIGAPPRAARDALLRWNASLTGGGEAT